MNGGVKGGVQGGVNGGVKGDVNGEICMHVQVQGVGGASGRYAQFFG